MTSLTHPEGATLLPVLVSRMAADRGIRALLIKGQAADHHQLRPARVSNDVDLFVEPAGFSELHHALIEAGWFGVDDTSQPTVVAEKHSVALQHQLWPLELDVHRRFPGFFAADAEVFDLLWDDRIQLELGGQDVPTAGLASSVIIGVLHAWRNPGVRKSEVELGQIEAVLRDSEPGIRDSISALVQLSGASAAGPDRWTTLGIDPGREVSADPEALLAWRIQADTGHQPLALGWLFELQRQPWYRKPGVLVRALLGANENQLRVRYPAAPPGRRGLWIIRWWRLKTMVKDVPRIVSMLRRHRQR
jgi:hypothetical protein